MFTPLRTEPCVDSETDWVAPPIDTDSEPVNPPPPMLRRSFDSSALPVMVPD